VCADRGEYKCSRRCHPDEACVLTGGGIHRCIRGEPQSPPVTWFTTRPVRPTAAGSGSSARSEYARTRTSMQRTSYGPNYVLSTVEPRRAAPSVEEQVFEEQDDRCNMGYVYNVNIGRCDGMFYLND